jgi:uncharacterized protein
MRFVCDVMLGKLAKYLRFLGFDSEYARTEASFQSVLSNEPDRIPLSRRSRISGPLQYTRIHSEMASVQLIELKGLLKPELDREKLLSRCIECNTHLSEVKKQEIEHCVPEYVFHQYQRFMACPSCHKLYWKGSHVHNIDKTLQELFS